MPPEIAIHEVEPQAIVSVREQCPLLEIPLLLQRSLGELYRFLGAVGTEPAGHPFVIYHAFGTDGVEMEVAVPVRERVAGTARIEWRVLEAMTVARTVHVGPYDTIGDSYASLTEWARAHEHEASGPILERYLVGPGDGVPASEFRTELEMPVVPEVIAAPV